MLVTRGAAAVVVGREAGPGGRGAAVAPGLAAAHGLRDAEGLGGLGREPGLGDLYLERRGARGAVQGLPDEVGTGGPAAHHALLRGHHDGRPVLEVERRVLRLGRHVREDLREGRVHRVGQDRQVEGAFGVGRADPGPQRGRVDLLGRVARGQRQAVGRHAVGPVGERLGLGVGEARCDLDESGLDLDRSTAVLRPTVVALVGPAVAVLATVGRGRQVGDDLVGVDALARSAGHGHPPGLAQLDRRVVGGQQFGALQLEHLRHDLRFLHRVLDGDVAVAEERADPRERAGEQRVAAAGVERGLGGGLGVDRQADVARGRLVAPVAAGDDDRTGREVGVHLVHDLGERGLAQPAHVTTRDLDVAHHLARQGCGVDRPRAEQQHEGEDRHRGEQEGQPLGGRGARGQEVPAARLVVALGSVAVAAGRRGRAGDAGVRARRASLGRGGPAEHERTVCAVAAAARLVIGQVEDLRGIGLRGPVGRWAGCGHGVGTGAGRRRGGRPGRGRGCRGRRCRRRWGGRCRRGRRGRRRRRLRDRLARGGRLRSGSGRAGGGSGRRRCAAGRDGFGDPVGLPVLSCG